MKSLYKYVSGLAFAGLLTSAIIEPAAAQRGFHGGGRISVGGGFHSGIGFGGRVGFSTGIRSYRLGGFYRGYGYYGYPHIGFHLGILPFGYYPFYWGPDMYYYYGGVFYRPIDGGGYEVATPPVGASVPELPKGAQPISINGEQFYEFNGVYYRQVTNDKGKTMYEVAGKDGVLNTDGDNGNIDNSQPQGPQVGDLVGQLPEGSRKVTLNGKKYYVSPDNVYYEDFADQNGNRSYRVASVPGQDDDQNDQNNQPQQQQN